MVIVLNFFDFLPPKIENYHFIDPEDLEHLLSSEKLEKFGTYTLGVVSSIRQPSRFKQTREPLQSIPEKYAIGLKNGHYSYPRWLDEESERRYGNDIRRTAADFWGKETIKVLLNLCLNKAEEAKLAEKFSEVYILPKLSTSHGDFTYGDISAVFYEVFGFGYGHAEGKIDTEINEHASASMTVYVKK